MTKLTPFERGVLDRLSLHAREHGVPTIVEAASVCGCSSSLVSKSVKKAGFSGYKEYGYFLSHGEIPESGAESPLSELERLKRVIDEFDPNLTAEFVSLLSSRPKILLFGYGPSHIVAEYAEYKLRLCLDAFIASPNDEASLTRLADARSLLVICTETGRYRSFSSLLQSAREKGALTVIVSEEFNGELIDACDRYMVLSRHRQPEHLQPFEKTRTSFFIFFEQAVQLLLERGRESSHLSG